MREGDLPATDSLEREDEQLTGPLADAASALLRQPGLANAERLRAVSHDTAAEAQWEIAWLVEDFDSLDVADDLLRPLVTARSSEMRALSYWLLATTQLARGHWQPARALLDSAATNSVAPPATRLTLSLPILVPFMPVPHAQLDSLRQALSEDWPPPGDVPESLRNGLRLYVRGVLSARLGDQQAALQAADTIERLPSATAQDRQTWARLANAVRAAAAFERGDYAATLDWLDRAPGQAPLPLLSTPANGEPERYLRAESLFRLGRLREALPWYENGFQRPRFGGFAAVWDAPCDFRLGEIYDRLGQPDRAAHAYARALALWSDPDPGLQPTVAAARHRLEELAGEGSRRH